MIPSYTLMVLMYFKAGYQGGLFRKESFSVLQRSGVSKISIIVHTTTSTK